MIEEVVNSILEAEDVAKKRVEEAEAKAAEIVANAEVEADAMRKQASLDNKKFQSKSLTDADEQAESSAKDKLGELNAKTDSEMAVLEKRIAKTVKVILESL